jgi:hypothetical protein
MLAGLLGRSWAEGRPRRWRRFGPGARRRGGGELGWQETESGPREKGKREEKWGSAQEKGKWFSIYDSRILRWKFKGEFEGNCYGFGHSKLQTKLKHKINSRAPAHFYKQF